MKEEIIKTLKEIEKERGITVIYACEFGSRSWGLDHAKSDYDIRFLYKWNKMSDYLRLEDKNDIIERNKGEMDIVGWDIKKALLLHSKNNPEIREWLISKDIYIEMDKNYFEGFSECDPSVLKQHYTGIIYSDFKKKQKGKEDKSLKRRLYDIRCILCWHAIDKGLSPEIKMLDLIGQVELEDKLKQLILQIIKDHKSQNQTITADDLSFIDKWIEDSFKMMVESNKKLTYTKKDKEPYNKRFYDIVTGKF
jgi:predicted nucleotidyltransferase